CKGFRTDPQGRCVRLHLITTTLPLREEQEVVIASDLQSIGVEIIKPFANVPSSRMFGSCTSGGIIYSHNFDLAMYTNNYAYPAEPDALAYTAYHSSQIPTDVNGCAGQNTTYISDPQLDQALDQARLSVRLSERKDKYIAAQGRLAERIQQDITVKNGQLAAVSDDASEGLGVRVLVDGAWGFAGSARLDKDEVGEVVGRAIRIARASARARTVAVDLGPPGTSRGRYRTPGERRPLSGALQLDRHGQRIGEEAVALLSAPQCPSGVKTLILDASQVALQVHESCGHPTELDRVFGMEAAYAGTSFMTPEKLNHLRYGSPRV